MANIAKLRSMLDLREIISETRTVINHGEYFLTLCPFHDDTKPSLRIEKERYHCFACNAHGDIFSWLQYKHNINFAEALKEAHFLAGLPFQSIASQEYSYGMPPGPGVAGRIEACKRVLPCRELVRVLLLNIAGPLMKYAAIVPTKDTDELRLLCDFYSIPYTWEGKLYALRAWEELCKEHDIPL